MSGGRTPRLLLRWSPRALTGVAVLAVLFLALGGIAGQLAGQSVLAGTDTMASQSPYAESGFAGTPSANVDLSDIYSSELPNTILFKESLRQGHPSQWNPYTVGGTPLGSITNSALLSPVAIPDYLLPSWLAPAYERLAEIVCAAVGCYFFLRRLRLAPPSALLGAMVYIGSAFMVAWLGWPQTRVAAFIPLLFWATERFLQERRVRDIAILAAVTASLLLGGFPAVEGYTLLTLGVYALARLLGERRHGLRELLTSGIGLGLGIAAGVGLALFQILPFAAFYRSWLIADRGQTDTSHLKPVNLVMSFAPWAYGGVGSGDSQHFYLPQNIVESMSYLGAAAIVLCFVATVTVRRGRALLPRGVWVFFVLAAMAWTAVIYRGGGPLHFLQDLPVLRSLFAANFIGRARSVTGFLFAVLAAIGFDLLLRRREPLEPGRWAQLGIVRVSRWARQLGVRDRRQAGRWSRALTSRNTVRALTLVPAVWLAWFANSELRHQLMRGRDWAIGSGTSSSAPGNTALKTFTHEVTIGTLLLAVSALCSTVLWFASRPEAKDIRWRIARFAAATAVLALVAGQGMQFISRYSPKANEATFYPATDTYDYLASNLGSQRYASTLTGVVLGTDVAYGLRTLNGHSFVNANLATMVQGIPDNPIPEPTHLVFADSVAQATSPILDRLGTEYFVAAMSEDVFGDPVPASSDGSTVELQSGQSVTLAVPSTGPLRAVSFIPTGTVDEAVSAADPDSWVDVVIHDASGAQVTETKRLTSGMTGGTAFEIPVAADSVAVDMKLTATLTLHAAASVSVQGSAAAVALSSTAGVDDGLALVHADTSVIYQRLDALPRIRWASSTMVLPTAADRVALLASGTLPASTVVLDAAGPAADGSPATVAVTDDGSDTISTTVTAEGVGYLVVADADLVGWSASVDGKPAALVHADEGVVAVAVPSGTHTVALRYTSPDGGAGRYASGATALVLLAAVGGEFWIGRRRRVRQDATFGSSAVGNSSDLGSEPRTDDQPGAPLRKVPLDGPEWSGTPL